MKKITRRRFISRSAAAVAAPYFIPGYVLGLNGAVAPSNRVTMGQIGIGNQGGGLFGGALASRGVQVLALCDVWESVRRVNKERAESQYAAEREKGSFKGVEAYRDFRDMLARDDIDAVIVATPDHWHALATIYACKAGKDVYCEKPLAQTVRGGREMVNAARRYGRVVTGGSQRVMEWAPIARCVRAGGLGKVLSATANAGGTSREFYLPEEPVPEGLDYDMWLGPAPWQPYNAKRVAGDYGGAYGWRRCRDYSGGGMVDWGAHYIAAAMYTVGVEHTGPVEIHPPGGAYKSLTYKFANGIILDVGGSPIVRGTEGEATHGKVPPIANPAVVEYKGKGGIFGDFLHCIQTRERPFQDVEIAHRASSACNLGNIALWLGRSLKWDPEKEEIIGDEEASRWLDRPMRAPWRY